MDVKRRLQEDLKEAVRAQDQRRVQAIRLLMAALERAQEEMGKEAFGTSQSKGEEIPPDREQPLSNPTLQIVVLARCPTFQLMQFIGIIRFCASASVRPFTALINPFLVNRNCLTNG